MRHAHRPVTTLMLLMVAACYTQTQVNAPQTAAGREVAVYFGTTRDLPATRGAGATVLTGVVQLAGYVSGVHGDTLRIEVRSITDAGGARDVRDGTVVRVVPDARTTINMRTLDGRRTAGAAAGVAGGAIIIALALLAALVVGWGKT